MYNTASPRSKAGNVIPFPKRRNRIQTSEGDGRHGYRAALVEDAAVIAVKHLHDLACLVSAACNLYDDLQRIISSTPKPAWSYLLNERELIRLTHARHTFAAKYPGTAWLDDLLRDVPGDPYADEILQGLLLAIAYKTMPHSLRRLRQAGARQC